MLGQRDARLKNGTISFQTGRMVTLYYNNNLQYVFHNIKINDGSLISLKLQRLVGADFALTRI